MRKSRVTAESARAIARSENHDSRPDECDGEAGDDEWGDVVHWLLAAIAIIRLFAELRVLQPMQLAVKH
jgi:hypothetical protein